MSVLCSPRRNGWIVPSEFPPLWLGECCWFYYWSLSLIWCISQRLGLGLGSWLQGQQLCRWWFFPHPLPESKKQQGRHMHSSLPWRSQIEGQACSERWRVLKITHDISVRRWGRWVDCWKNLLGRKVARFSFSFPLLWTFMCFWRSVWNTIQLSLGKMLCVTLVLLSGSG